MESATRERELSGEKAQRIIEAMRRSVAERGIERSTFEHVAREAGVSRGLLHYYFGTKEKLLVEVVRRDAELRTAMLDATLEQAESAKDVVDSLVANLRDLMNNDPGYFSLLFEVFVAGQNVPEVRNELGALFARNRASVAEVLERKQAEGVIRMRFDADATISCAFSLGHGLVMQLLSDFDHDPRPAIEAATGIGYFLFDS